MRFSSVPSSLPRNTPKICFTVPTIEGDFDHDIYDLYYNRRRTVRTTNGFAIYDRVIIIGGEHADRTGFVKNANNRDFIIVHFDKKVNDNTIDVRIEARKCMLAPWPQDEETQSVRIGDGSISARLVITDNVISILLFANNDAQAPELVPSRNWHIAPDTIASYQDPAVLDAIVSAIESEGGYESQRQPDRDEA